MIGINKKSQKSINQLLVICIMVAILVLVIATGDMK